MSKKVRKSIGEYIFKMKTPKRPQLRLPQKKWVLTGCRHTRTSSLDMDNFKLPETNKVQDDEAMLADIDRFLLENFKSLFLDDSDDSHHREQNSPNLGPIRFDSSPRYEESPLNPFTDTTSEPRSSSAMSESDVSQDQTPLPGNCIVVLANSDSPTEDFRRSMEGLVEARLRKCGKVDWDFMQEVMFCHMKLNQKKSHKFILSAFVDVVTAMRRPPETKPVIPRPSRSVRTVRIGREVRRKTKEALTLDFGSP